MTVCITASCTYLVHVYATDDKEIKNYLSAIVGVSNVCTFSPLPILNSFLDPLKILFRSINFLNFIFSSSPQHLLTRSM